MNTITQKLSSRKLWSAIAGVVTGLAMIFGLDESVVSTIAGAVVTLASTITYIATEGRIDAAAISRIGEIIQEVETVIEDGKTIT